jgi:oxygen-independent coproporphyrinogen-3 oxidase
MSAGVYLHIPFCKSRCSYCDFATDVYRNGDAVERYVNALCKEIETFAKVRAAGVSGQADVYADTIYFGGGTPSLLSPKQVGTILTAVRETFAVHPAAEITMEMNPATVTSETLADYKSWGVNRASFGVQTFDDTELKRLARGHNAQDARDTFRMLREAGFRNISFDLIAGLPRQTLADWERNLDEALAMRPEHLSLYLLEVHESTPLAEQIKSERQPLPDEQLAADMYELMLAKVASAGYVQYEISNFALPGFESRHNSKYWTLDPVYGFGVSAHSFDGVVRYANGRDTNAYVSVLETDGSPEAMREAVDVASEYIFLGLRLNRGIGLAEYSKRFGADLEDKYAEEIGRLKDLELVAISDDRMFLTGKGMLFSNEVFAAFV